jgi:hypothetical protein
VVALKRARLMRQERNNGVAAPPSMMRTSARGGAGGAGIVRLRVARVLLLALGGTAVAIGAWALVAPATWFERFPGFGRAWTAVLPPYNEHLARDVGGFNLMMGALFLWAAVGLERRLVRAVCFASLLFAVPHTVFHALHLEGVGTPDRVGQMVALALSVVGPLVAAWLVNAPRTNGE